MKIHFLGIGGSGESAVAAIAQAHGFEVSGCDTDIESEFLKPFSKEQISQGHSKRHLYPNVIASEQRGNLSVEIPTLLAPLDDGKDINNVDKQVDLLVITPAILSLDPNNEELVEAKKQNIPILTWQEFMGKFLHKDKFVIAVAGTHGKTTTTAMISQILVDAGLDPTVELGAIYQKWGANFRSGNSKYFVTEADEFNNNFLNYHPDIAVVTNIDFDHPEFFKDFEDYQESFKRFLSSTKIKIVANLSDPVVSKALAFQTGIVKVKIIDYSKLIVDFPLKVLGEFNRLNASAAFQVGLVLGLDANTIRNSLMTFNGVGRRMEFIGEFKLAKIYSDFGHHPTEIKVTVEALRKKYPDKRIWVIFQPHMFSRTKALFNDFVKVLQNLPIDQISILDIYPSREVDTGLVNSQQLVQAVAKTNVSYLGPKEEVKDFLKLAIRKDDIVLFIGAGDIDKIAREIVKK